MNAISTKPLSFGSPENKNKFNSAELNNDFQLNQYEFFFRNYEPQIGRFWQLDPKPVDSISLYAFGLNNPIKYFDLLGDTVGIDLLRNEVEPELNNPNKRGANGVNDGVFAVFAHANDRFVQLRESDGKPYGMYNKEALNNVLSTLSPEWKKAMEEKKEITLIIYGCNSGSKEYWDVHNNVLVCNQNPIAQQMSEYSNLTVVAPNGYFVYGQFQDGYTKPMAVMQTSLSQHDNTGQGALITFKGGKAIAEMKFAFNGTGKPDKGKKKLLK